MKKKTLTSSEMGKKSWEARKAKYGDKVMSEVRKGKKGKFDKRSEVISN